MEIRDKFQSLADWQSYEKVNPSIIDPNVIEPFGPRIIQRGFVEPLTGIQVPANAAELGGGLREGLVYRGVSSRVRAVMLTIEDLIGTTDIYAPRIYAAEGLTPFALRMRGIFPRFIGSEYTDEPHKREWLSPIPVEDLLRLSFASNTFDLVSTNEVLEHVPSIDQAMREIHRVLQPGGWHIGTCPFYFMFQESVVKAKLDKGRIVHLMEPEYHGNPMSAQGSLVFELPGWNLMDRLRGIGFREVYMRFVASEEHGILCGHATGIFVLCCQK